MADAEEYLTGLVDNDREALERWLAGFEQSWSDHSIHDWKSRLPPTGSWYGPALVEMAIIDLERRWNRGDHMTVESFLERHPELGTPGTVSLGLIRAEIVARRRHGESVSVETLFERFPGRESDIRKLLDETDPGTGLVQPMPRRVSTMFQDSREQAAGRAKKLEDLPQQFGRYRILRKLGECGMGAVYLVHDDRLGRQVALKVPRFMAEDNSEVGERFEREARAAATLSHANLCSVYDVGEIDGIRYLTMAYIEGVPLSDLEENLSQRDHATLILKIARAMQYAHERGVLHRDLKPSNIMLTRAGDRSTWEPVVIDFGLALRQDGGDARMTPGGAIMGTPAYMSPESALNGTGASGPQGDVYSLGVMMYELLAGCLPFKGNALEVVCQVATTEPPLPSRYRPGLDSRLETICMKAMARLTADRYASMSEFASALDGYLESADVKPTLSPSIGPSRSKRLKALVIASCVLLLLAVGLVAREYLRSAPAAGNTPEATLPTLGLQWHGFVQSERGGQELDLILRDGMTLHSGDQYRLVVSPNQDCYLYIIGVDVDGPALLFPNEQISTSNSCKSGEQYQLPDGINWYTLDNRIGIEMVYIIASHKLLNDLEALLTNSAANAAERTSRVEALLETLERVSAKPLLDRGQTIQPDRRIATAKLKSGKELREKMDIGLGSGYVVKRIRFNHQPSAK